ncbi:HD domain-containing phosphohydrolase [Cetobacterium sp.]|uniref:HD domain-containing phosphohydrolase n=1 Tax=Cetobacterium sp. TaxID=2071632 RepID=UPI003F3E7FA6
MLLKLVISFIFIYINTFSIQLSREEINWIKQNQNTTFTISVYNPKHIYLYENEHGELSGVYTTFFQEISDKTGLNFKFKSLKKDELINTLKNNEEDIIFNISRTEDREKNYSFLPTLNSYTLGLYSKNDTTIDINNLYKYKIGLIPTTSDSLLIKQFYPELKNTISISDNESFGLWALDEGIVDAMIGKSSNDILKTYKFTPFRNIPSSQLWVAINKKQPVLESIISKFKTEFTNNHVAKILKQERPIFYSQLLKNEKIVSRVKSRYSNLKVFIPDIDRMLPLFYKTKNGYKGYVIDRLDELSSLTGLPITYTNNPNDNYDLKVIDSRIFKNNNTLYFVPYYKIQITAFSRNNENFIDSFQSLENKKVGVISYEDINLHLLSFLPNFKFYKFYPDTNAALNALLKNEINYVYGDFKIVSMGIANRYLENKIKVAGFLDSTQTIGFGIKQDADLAKLVDKLFPNHLSESRILQSELTVSKKLSPNYKYLVFVLSTLFITIATLFYLLRKATIASQKEKRISKALVQSFEAANELNDEDTGNHILRVNLYSKFLAEKLKCPNKFIKAIAEYASLHDVGKIAISDTILKKPGKLTPEEFEDMKKHVIFGKELILKMQLGDIAENIALYHHEKWSGKGYCFGLAGKSIPLEARIVALADVYDALRQKRVYKEGFSHEVAVEIIKKERGEHFDPALVDIFLEHHSEFDKIFITH